MKVKRAELRAATANGNANRGNGPLLARASVAVPASAEDEFMFMPAGRHQITCSQDDSPVSADVLVEKSAASALQAQFEAVTKKTGHKPYFDFDHSGGPASFWPEQFLWREAPAAGIYARGSWSKPGRDAVEGKSYRAFSPVFWVDDPEAKPARIICHDGASLDFGSLVNDPAFRKISPLWAKNSEPNQTMKQTLAELQASLTTLETEITALKAKAGTDANAAAQLEARESRADLVREKIKTAQMEARLQARAEKDADTAIETAIKRGALAPQAKELHAKWRSAILADPANEVLLASLNASAVLDDKKITEGGPRLEGNDSPNRILKAYGELAAANLKIPFNARTSMDKRDLALKAAALYKKEMSKDFSLFRGALMAADATDANLGILTGTLVAQRTLQFFRFNFKLLKRIYTDFSDMPAAYKQVVNTRIVVRPATMAYDNTADANGLPKGWSAATAPQTTNVNLTFDELIGVPIRFGMDILSETVRRLFDEQAPAAAAAMQEYFSNKIYKLLTPANYNAYAAVSAPEVAAAYANYPVGLGDFGRGTLAKIAAIMDPNRVPDEDRSVLLNPAYWSQAANDPSIVTFFAGQRAPEIIEQNELPMLAGYQPLKAPNLTKSNATANLVGFALQKAGLIAGTRLPVDINQILPGAQLGSVMTIADEDLDAYWQLVQYVNQTAGFAEWRLQALLAAAVGDTRAGLCITSQ